MIDTVSSCGEKLETTFHQLLHCDLHTYTYIYIHIYIYILYIYIYPNEQAN